MLQNLAIIFAGPIGYGMAIVMENVGKRVRGKKRYRKQIKTGRF